MNERIKLLADQSWEYARERQNSPDEDNEDSYYRNFQEKFAELIVQECANKIAESFIPEDELIEDYKKDWDNTMRFAANSIKQHFGVDE